MNFQIVVVILIFLVAIFYVARLVYNSVTTKKGCGSNCKCGVDFSEVEVNKSVK